MRIAQQLYEGVSVRGHGSIGLITYLRTDSTRISAEADAAARAYIKEVRETKKPVMTGPSVSGTSGKLITIMAYPVLTNGQVSGVVYGTVSLAELSELVGSFEYMETGYVYVVDEGGVCIGYKQLPDAVVLNGDVTDHELLQEEGIESTDAFVALTGLDEGNILSALYAKHRKVSKVIAKVNNESLETLTKDVALDSVISPKNVVSNQILRYVRAREASADQGEIRGLYKIADGSIEVLEFMATAENKNLLDIPLKDLRTKQHILIACIVRNGKAIIPGGMDSIQAGDVVLVVTGQRLMNDLGDIMEDAK